MKQLGLEIKKSLIYMQIELLSQRLGKRTLRRGQFCRDGKGRVVCALCFMFCTIFDSRVFYGNYLRKTTVCACVN